MPFCFIFINRALAERMFLPRQWNLKKGYPKILLGSLPAIPAMIGVPCVVLIVRFPPVFFDAVTEKPVLCDRANHTKGFGDYTALLQFDKHCLESALHWIAIFHLQFSNV